MNAKTIPSPGRDTILRLYSERGSWAQVKDHFGVSYEVLRRWRREEGITDETAAACRQFAPTTYRTRDRLGMAALRLIVTEQAA